jgi:tetratricopeptide (TPR) repeat protein
VRRLSAILAILALVGIALAIRQAAARDRDYRLEIERGDTALRDDKTSDALEAYSGASALRPDSMLAVLRRGETYLLRGEIDAAAKDFARAAELDPLATRPLEELGDAEYRRQRYAQAEQSYEKRLGLDDRSPEVSYKLALTQYRSGNWQGALSSLDHALKFDPQLPEAEYLRAICLREAHRLDDAVHAAERAVSLAPASIPAREELADLYAALDRPSDQIAQLQALAALDPGRAERQVAVGRSQARAGHWDLAILTLGGALEHTSNAAMIYQALGQVWLERPRGRGDRIYLSKAREAIERVAVTTDASSELLMLYARVLMQDGEIERAERVLQQASVHFPIDPPALLEYASVAETLNHRDVARKALVSYFALSNGHEDPARVTVLASRLGVRARD